ncbi:MAG: hypothetical protein H7833_13645 [Magnetococcus sp. DMHC-1]
MRDNSSSQNLMIDERFKHSPKASAKFPTDPVVSGKACLPVLAGSKKKSQKRFLFSERSRGIEKAILKRQSRFICKSRRSKLPEIKFAERCGIPSLDVTTNEERSLAPVRLKKAIRRLDYKSRRTQSSRKKSSDYSGSVSFDYAVSTSEGKPGMPFLDPRVVLPVPARVQGRMTKRHSENFIFSLENGATGYLPVPSSMEKSLSRKLMDYFPDGLFYEGFKVAETPLGFELSWPKAMFFHPELLALVHEAFSRDANPSGGESMATYYAEDAGIHHPGGFGSDVDLKTLETLLRRRLSRLLGAMASEPRNKPTVLFHGIIPDKDFERDIWNCIPIHAGLVPQVLALVKDTLILYSQYFAERPEEPGLRWDGENLYLHHVAPIEVPSDVPQLKVINMTLPPILPENM